eukprot:gene25642-biopygen13541
MGKFLFRHPAVVVPCILGSPGDCCRVQGTASLALERWGLPAVRDAPRAANAPFHARPRGAAPTARSAAAARGEQLRRGRRRRQRGGGGRRAARTDARVTPRAAAKGVTPRAERVVSQ